MKALLNNKIQSVRGMRDLYNEYLFTIYKIFLARQK